MPSSTKHNETKKRPSATEAEVVSYLKQNPDFLVDHPELLAVLVPPAYHGGPKVVDMQSFLIDRLKGEVARLKLAQGEILEASRANMASQSTVHDAVLSLLDAQSFEHLIRVVSGDLPAALGVDAVSICIESAEPKRWPDVTALGVRVLDVGDVDAIMGADREIVLIQGPESDARIFGARHNGQITSRALVRLNISRVAPAGMLALGSIHPDTFHPGQATELLHFFTRALERSIRAWLNLPPT